MQKPERYVINTTSFAYYWQHGAGKELLEHLGYTPNINDAEQFIPYLFSYDNLGDEIVKETILKYGFTKGFNEILSALQQNNFTQNSNTKTSFLQQINKNPSWLDKTLFDTGSRFCRRAGVSALIVLRDYCLMGGYESSAINKPLIFTEALKKGAVKRLAETLEFWVNITRENAFEDNLGKENCIKTRLIHSYSRIMILDKTNWKNEKWGIPLNSWDMLATNLGFSMVFLVGMRKIGLKPSQTEINGLFHFWKYIGYLLGIPLELLPSNENEAIKALYFWTMTQNEGDTDSIALAHALTAEPLLVKKPRLKIFRKLLQQSHLAYNYYFLGEYSCKRLQLPKSYVKPLIKLNIKANIKQQKFADISAENYLKMVTKGAKEQEEVKRIYLTINTSLLQQRQKTSNK